MAKKNKRVNPLICGCGYDPNPPRFTARVKRCGRRVEIRRRGHQPIVLRRVRKRKSRGSVIYGGLIGRHPAIYQEFEVEVIR